MSVEYTCDGCGKKAPAEKNGHNWEQAAELVPAVRQGGPPGLVLAALH